MPSWHIHAAVALGEPPRPSHISKMVLSIVKIGPPNWKNQEPLQRRATAIGPNRAVAPHYGRERTVPGAERAGERRSAGASRSTRYFGGDCLARLALATTVTGDGPPDNRQPVLRRTRRRAGLDSLPAPDPFGVDRLIANLTEPSGQAGFSLGREPPLGVPPIRVSQIVQIKASSGAG